MQVIVDQSPYKSQVEDTTLQLIHGLVRFLHWHSRKACQVARICPCGCEQLVVGSAADGWREVSRYVGDNLHRDLAILHL